MSDSAKDTVNDTAVDAKAKFREALERKQGKRHPHEAATQGEAKVNDTHGAAGGKRTFRRKSG